MRRPAPSPHAVDALTEAIIDRLEAAHAISVQASTADVRHQRKRWISLMDAGNEIAALAKCLEILTRPP
jgi:DNA-binding MarR family transcriptional regulator